MAKFSERDAEVLPIYYKRLETVATFLRQLAEQTPPSPKHKLEAVQIAFSTMGKFIIGGPKFQRDTLDLFTKSARNFLERWLESAPLQAVLGFDSVVGNYAGPSSPGSAYVLLHHVFGEVDGAKGEWGHAIGGMGAITETMRQACIDAGVKISTETPVQNVLVDRETVHGVVLDDGTEVTGRRVVSNVNPKLLYGTMIPHETLEPKFAERMTSWRCASGTFRMNVALSELPDFECLPGKDLAEHHQAGIIIAPTLDYMDRAFEDAQQHGWSKHPIVEMVISSTLDDTLAPRGAHVASLFCQQFAPELPDGQSWHNARERAADDIIETVNRFAPNFKASVIARQCHSPLDLEERFGLIGGDIMHGQMTLDQLWALRPAWGYGDYRGPLRGLYMCGAGSHPGGGVTGLPGRNAAREILRDARLAFTGTE